MKILVTGANGQLGSELRELADGSSDDFVFTDLPELDLTDEMGVSSFIDEIKPAFIINCGAYTAVDKAEVEKELAYKINCDAVRVISDAARRNDSFLIHISTDYVFDGKGNSPYREDDPVSPMSVYGYSKLGGEKEVKAHTSRALIIRTSWLYSTFGHNFVRTMLRLGKERGEVNIVSDQLGCPTYAHDLAKAIIDIIPQCSTINDVEVFHFCNRGMVSWFNFAKAIFELSGIHCRVNPIRTKDFPTAAVRPLYSVLDTSKICSRFGIEIPDWKVSLEKMLNKIKA